MNSHVETPYLSYPTESGYEKIYLRFITVRRRKFIVNRFHGIKIEFEYEHRSQN